MSEFLEYVNETPGAVYKRIAVLSRDAAAAAARLLACAGAEVDHEIHAGKGHDVEWFFRGDDRVLVNCSCGETLALSTEFTEAVLPPRYYVALMGEER